MHLHNGREKNTWFPLSLPWSVQFHIPDTPPERPHQWKRWYITRFIICPEIWCKCSCKCHLTECDDEIWDPEEPKEIDKLQICGVFWQHVGYKYTRCCGVIGVVHGGKCLQKKLYGEQMLLRIGKKEKEKKIKKASLYLLSFSPKPKALWDCYLF